MTEIWTYGGKRLSAKDTLIDCWIDAEENSLLFKKLSAHDVGGFYEVEVDRSSGGASVKGQPKWLGKKNESLRDELLVRDKLSRQYHARKRREKNQPDQLETLLDPVVELFSKCRTSAERQAFLFIVNDYLYQNYR